MLQVEDFVNSSLRRRIPYFLDAYPPRVHGTFDHSLNALLLEFDKVAATGRDAFVDLIALSGRVAGLDIRLFSQRGKFIDTLNPLYDAYLKLVEAATDSHAACAKYLLLRRKICQKGSDSVPPEQIDEVILAFSRHLHQMSHFAAEIETQWTATTDALRAVVNSYCLSPSLVSIIQWVDSRNAARFELPSLLDALSETIHISTDRLGELICVYADFEEALNQVEEHRRAGLGLGSEYDFEIALFGLIQLDTAVRYRASLLIANRWILDRATINNVFLSGTPLRDVIWKTGGDFLLNYWGTRNPRWFWDFRYDVGTLKGM